MSRKHVVGFITAMSLSASSFAAEVSISGQVVPAMLFGGDVDKPEIVDNTASGSRFRFRASEEVGNLKAYMRYEMQAQENASFGAVDGSESFDTRYAEVGVQGGFGKLSLGKGDGASNGTAEATFFLSGNFYGAGPLPLFSYKGTLERDNPDIKVGWTYFDGFSRVSRLRYDSPSFGGLSFSASLDSKDRNELAARFKRDLGFADILVFFGQANTGDGDGDRTMFSGGLALKNGLFATAAFSKQDSDTSDDLESQLLSIGYKNKKFVISGDIGESGVDGENEVTSLGFTYRVSKKVDLYANTTKYDNADGSSLSGNLVGARFKF